MKEVFDDFENDDWEEVSGERSDFSENPVFRIRYYFYDFFIVFYIYANKFSHCIAVNHLKHWNQE